MPELPRSPTPPSPELFDTTINDRVDIPDGIPMDDQNSMAKIPVPNIVTVPEVSEAEQLALQEAQEATDAIMRGFEG